MTGGAVRLLAGLLGARSFDFAFQLVFARSLGAEAFGIFTYAFSLVLLFSVVADFGLTTAFVRRVAVAPTRACTLLSRILGLRTALGVLAIGLAVGTAAAAGGRGELLAQIAVLATALVLNTMASLFEGLLKAAGRAGSAGIPLLVQSAAGGLGGTLLLALGAGLWAGIWGWLAGGVAHLLFAAWAARGVSLPGGSGTKCEDVPAAGALLREAWPLAFSGAFIALYFRIDAVLLHLLRDEREVGLYGAVYRLFAGLGVLSTAYRSVVFPFLARAADGPTEALAALCRRSLRLQLLGTSFVAVFVSVLARPLVHLLFGSGYDAAAPALAILIWALPASFMADLLFHLMVARQRSMPAMQAVAGVALLNLTLNLALIPRWGTVGAAATTVISEFTTFALLLVLAGRGLPRIAPDAAGRALLATAGLVPALGIIAAARFDPVAALGMAAAIGLPFYILLLRMFGALDAADFTRLRVAAVRQLRGGALIRPPVPRR